MENKWRIIVNKLAYGEIEYQVSDGSMGKRTISYDFKYLWEAKLKCKELNKTSQ